MENVYMLIVEILNSLVTYIDIIWLQISPYVEIILALGAYLDIVLPRIMRAIRFFRIVWPLIRPYLSRAAKAVWRWLLDRTPSVKQTLNTLRQKGISLLESKKKQLPDRRVRVRLEVEFGALTIQLHLKI